MSNFTNIQVASLNVRGLGERNKRTHIFDFFANSNFSVIFLQETKTTLLNENDIRKEWHNRKCLINSSPSENASGGCMILFNTPHVCVLNSIVTADGRCIVADIDLGGCRYHLVNVYFPNDSSEKLSFLNSFLNRFNAL